MLSPEARQHRRIMRKVLEKQILHAVPSIREAARSGAFGSKKCDMGLKGKLYKFGETEWRDKNGQWDTVDLCVDKNSGRLYMIIRTNGRFAPRRIRLFRTGLGNLHALRCALYESAMPTS